MDIKTEEREMQCAVCGEVSTQTVVTEFDRDTSVPDLDMNKGNVGYTTFVKDFTARWGVEPGEDKVSGLSYDAANIIFTAFNAIRDSQDDMTHFINVTKDFRGIYGDIKFRRGANANTKIVTVNKGKFEVVNVCERQDAAAKEAKSKKKK